MDVAKTSLVVAKLSYGCSKNLLAVVARLQLRLDGRSKTFGGSSKILLWLQQNRHRRHEVAAPALMDVAKNFAGGSKNQLRLNLYYVRLKLFATP